MPKFPLFIAACLVMAGLPVAAAAADPIGPGTAAIDDVGAPAADESLVTGLIVKMKAGSPAEQRSLRMRATAGSVTAADVEAGQAEASARALIEDSPLLDEATVVTQSGSGDGSAVINLGDPLTAAAAESLAGELADRADVEWAEPDYRMFATDVAPVVPSDELFDKQWGLWDTFGSAGRYSVRAPEAWQITKGSPSVVVAVLDTGITTHPDLDARRVAGYDMISDPKTANDGNGRDSNPSDPGDWINSKTRPSDCPKSQVPDEDSSWHGTHVAGIIAASQNSIGVTGIAPGVRIQPVRVLGVCGGSTSDIAAAVRWASGGTVAGVPANKTPAKVLNISLGGPGPCGNTMQSAINEARGRGALVVVAAGNSAMPASQFSPANCKNVVVVAATGRKGQRASYSNYGTGALSATIAAPGGDTDSPGSSSIGTSSSDKGILSTYNTGKTKPAAAGYAYLEGTSMAAPQVSGVAALVLSKVNLTPADLTSRLKASAQPFPRLGTGSGKTCTTVACGAGIVDAGAAVAAVTIAPANDDFAAATLLTGQSGSRSGINVGATEQAGEPKFPTNTGGASVWYRYVAPSTGTFSASTAGSNFDTLIGVYRGETLGGLTRLAANNNAKGVVTSAVGSVPMTKGTTYYLLVDGARNGTQLPAAGSFRLSWQLQFFSDVAPGTQFFNEVEWMAAQKISLGNPDGTYSPAATVTRQAMAAFFYRLNHDGADAPACTSGSPFSDVPKGHPFCGAVTWLSATGITGGIGGGKFGPGLPVTREAMAAFLYRYHQMANGVPTTALTCTGNSRSFVDVKKSHPFCGEIEWAAHEGVTTGNPTSAGLKYLPADKVSRIAVAAFLFRLSELQD